MIRLRHLCALVAALTVASATNWLAGSPVELSIIPEAEAIIGRPLTPLSYAGVARRTTRRAFAVAGTAAVATGSAVVAESYAQPAPTAAAPGALPIGTIVPALPAGCSQLTSNGVEYYKCGADYYRAAFQGSNLVYVTAQP